MCFALVMSGQGGAWAQPREGFADLNDRLSPAVVNIATAQRVGPRDGLPVFPPGSPLERFNDMLGEGPRMARSLGSGFIIDPEGLVVTNNHVIEDADAVEVVLQDGRVLAAEIIGRDPATDLAVLRVEAGEGLPYVPFGDSDGARVGDWVVAIGNPFGLGGSLTVGVISARGRDIGGQYDDYLQSDVSINRGNSGGPLFNLDGEVIGVNTAIFSPTGASVGISFSVPSAVARPVVDQLISFGETRRGWLGVNVQPVTADMARAMGLSSARGAVVTRIDPDGPAAEAELQPGDVILAIGGRAVADDRRLTRIVAETEPESRVALEVFRRGESLTLNVTIARLQERAAPARPGGQGAPEREPRAPASASVFGLTLAPITDALRRQYRIHPDADGLVVTEVDPDSDASGKVRVGDVLEEIAWTRVEGLEQARELAETARAGGPVLVTLNRQGQYLLQTLRG
ncbi:PDZ domain-containing protein [Alkalicaulis satelles]|uniref:PDZ domain-containing protein n=2 Tax=Alkalicaulis satelles TaxID=2609175 RepID=A0A5M6ZKW7_9PROT|nr:PDZ domain-containing protein [Alkalicaulis satelles]